MQRHMKKKKKKKTKRTMTSSAHKTHPIFCFCVPFAISTSSTSNPKPLITAMRPPPRLITFDIDGTLLKSIGPKGNAAHHEAMNSAAVSIFGDKVNKVKDVAHQGSTDMAIMRRMCTTAGISNSVVNDKLEIALADAASRIHTIIDPNADYTHLVLPGIIPILQGLKSRGVSLSLATGNIQDIAWAKLKSARLHHYFNTGGFGDDAEDRKDIVAKAIQRSGQYTFDDVVHIGDSLADVAISRQIGVDTVGVLTGVFTRQQLEAEKPLFVFDDFSDTEKFFKILGFDNDNF